MKIPKKIKWVVTTTLDKFFKKKLKIKYIIKK